MHLHLLARVDANVFDGRYETFTHDRHSCTALEMEHQIGASVAGRLVGEDKIRLPIIAVCKLREELCRYRLRIGEVDCYSRAAADGRADWQDAGVCRTLCGANELEGALPDAAFTRTRPHPNSLPLTLTIPHS